MNRTSKVAAHKTDTVTVPEELPFQKMTETLRSYTDKQLHPVAKERPKGGTATQLGGSGIQEYRGQQGDWKSAIGNISQNQNIPSGRSAWGGCSGERTQLEEPSERRAGLWLNPRGSTSASPAPGLRVPG